jgi:hypothetical protein
MFSKTFRKRFRHHGEIQLAITKELLFLKMIQKVIITPIIEYISENALRDAFCVANFSENALIQAIW